ncbi:hypothetical protein HH310_29985 [Actinoplanes sp. TBRC 11911]|uniref:hypothetical protein n=1 Tax=Actinoplanes sp. TBRC 11911 TaxID=2729386 RepID=UPI00145F4851|nr:hypothetical protein [Actinoplanes sp. TBRC 11911]NMO55400.1 hypothetical protein [Actinoplanes sp. TBRC 11911]
MMIIDRWMMVVLPDRGEGLTSAPGAYGNSSFVDARRVKNDWIIATGYAWARGDVRHEPAPERALPGRRQVGDRHLAALHACVHSRSLLADVGHERGRPPSFD